MEASFTKSIDSEEDILGLLPEAHFERKIPIVDLMAQVWWVAHFMKLSRKMRHNVQNPSARALICFDQSNQHHHACAHLTPPRLLC